MIRIRLVKKLAWTIKVSFGRQVEGESDFIGKISKKLGINIDVIGSLWALFLASRILAIHGMAF